MQWYSQKGIALHASAIVLWLQAEDHESHIHMFLIYAGGVGG
jgi:hypothetical protein